jgi:hypothetical protein
VLDSAIMRMNWLTTFGRLAITEPSPNQRVFSGEAR